MQPLRPLEIPLIGKNLIQASAGTGKTWTISLLYIRLIVEQLLTVDQLLVVTYTRAATEELRGRIRERIKEALGAYEHPEDIEKSEYHTLLAAYPASPERIWFLQRALVGFDEAAIFTIHGFCQRVLQEHAFEVGLPFESELVNSEADLQLALADQFWQQRLLHPHALDIAALQQQALTPDNLLADVTDFIGKPYLQPIRPEPVNVDDYQSSQQTYQSLLTDLRTVWQTARSEILELLGKPGQLNKAQYSTDKLTSLAITLDDFLNGKADADISKTLEKVTPATLAAKTNKTGITPQHVFFELMEDFLPNHDRLADMQTQALDQLRYDLLVWLREQLPERKRQAGVLAFDDLLVNLQDALAARPELAEQLSAHYRVALIDEFQDTDPVQYQVFEQIYRHSDGQVYYVGDPKQAIYSFRGADIYTYLQAADSVGVEQQYTLDRNFRSHAALIQAFNHLYAQAPDPFRNQQRIHYEAVAAGGTVTNTLNTTPVVAPLRLWDWDGSQTEGVGGLAEVCSQIALAVATDIARLVQQGREGIALIGERPVVSGDCAVLVRSHRQGRMIKEALQRCGIASVQKSPLGIFQTHEAAELRVVLAAVVEPNHVGKVRRALVTELMGGSAASLLAMDVDQQQLDQALGDFYHWHQLWLKHGFMRMLRAWMDSRGVRKRLLAYVNGERRLTNLLHLGELIHTETRRQWQGMQAALRWLQRQARERSDEEHQLRLESDENLVQIVTIHKSKGLQYGIVYCPFLWNETEEQPKGHWFAWHDPDNGSSCLQAGQHGLEKARANRLDEDRSENLRLLYVALTRAQYQCTLVLASGEISRFNYASALGWLLFGHLPDSDKLLSTKSSLPPPERQQQMHTVLTALTTRAKGSIGWEPLPVDNITPVQHSGSSGVPAGQARQFTGRIPPIQRIGSFSGLSSGKHDERPDYDQPYSIQLQAPKAFERDLSVFPGGMRAGVCLHKMFEMADFQLPLAEQYHKAIEQPLQEQGYGLEWAPAAEQLLQRTLHAPLLPGQSLCLADVAQAERLDEMEFYFPVEHLRVDLLKRTLLYYLPDDWLAIRTAVHKLGFADLKGFMKGFIDLVFRADGKFYIVDYKSNWLGNQANAYAPDKLEQAMADAQYYLQYLIYCVAVHRYLQQRVKDYEWETHVGGVLYLFLRGMGTGDETQTGVFFHKPAVAFIDALDGLMELET